MSSQRRSLERSRWAAALVIAVATLGWPAVPARASGIDETLLLTLTNAVRAGNGLPGLTLDSGLSATARQWASAMAAAGAISHNPDLKSQIPSNWAKTGENVGYGTAVEKVHALLVDSPPHLRNIVDPEFERVGIGVVRSNNLVWIVEVFFTPAGSSGWSADPEPEPEPAQEAAPEPTAEPAPVTAAPVVTAAPDPEPTTSTTTTVAPATTSTLTPAAAPPPGLPLGLTLMVQQVRTLGING